MTRIHGFLIGICAAALFTGCQTQYNPNIEVVDATSSHGRVVGSRHYGRNATSRVRQGNATAKASSRIRPYSEVAGADSGTYKVQQGDTLYSIAFRYGQDFRELARRNGIAEPYNIKTGQVLKIADTVQAAQKAEPKPQTAAAGSRKTSQKYVVKTGDSVNSVSRQFSVPVADIVAANKLKAPYYLKRGSTIVIPAATTSAKASDSTDNKTKNVKTASLKDTVVAKKTEIIDSKGQSTVVANEELTQEPIQVVPGKTRTVGGVVWRWPAQGKVVKNFASIGEHANNGIDISGSRGQNVMAAADGKVVYAGNALRGYGNLVIINHNSEYLSAYAHNDSLLVKEGQSVKRGQVISRMGSTDSNSVKLHFEIRKKGTSVNPQLYLPK